MTHLEFEPIAQQHADMLYRIAYNYLKNKEDSEDAVQNVLIRLFRHNKPFQSDEHMKAWLIRVTINESKRILAGVKKRAEVNLEEVASALYVDDIAGRDLFISLMQLKPVYSTVLYLYYCESYSTEEIAEMLHKSGQAVRAILSRARKKLKLQLMEDNNG